MKLSPLDQGHIDERSEDLQIELRKRFEVEHALEVSKQRYERLISTIPCAVYDYVLWPDGRSRFLYISPQCQDIFEYGAEEIMENATLLWNMVYPEDFERLQNDDRMANQSGDTFQSEVRIVLPSGKMKWIQLTSRPGPAQVDDLAMWSGVILDITERKLAEEERIRLVAELQSALAEVKLLSGFLPICSSCKKIRDDQGYWNQIEAYICDHSEAVFSHGICPDCAEKYYAELRKMDAPLET